jgi:hypothetical protein
LLKRTLNLPNETEQLGGDLHSDLNLTEGLAELKRSTSPIAHIDQQVEDAEKLLPQLQWHGCLPVGNILAEYKFKFFV